MFNNVSMTHHHNLIRKMASSRQIMGNVQHADVFFLLNSRQQVKHA